MYESIKFEYDDVTTARKLYSWFLNAGIDCEQMRIGRTPWNTYCLVIQIKAK